MRRTALGGALLLAAAPGHRGGRAGRASPGRLRAPSSGRGRHRDGRSPGTRTGRAAGRRGRYAPPRAALSDTVATGRPVVCGATITSRACGVGRAHVTAVTSRGRQRVLDRPGQLVAAEAAGVAEDLVRAVVLHHVAWKGYAVSPQQAP